MRRTVAAVLFLALVLAPAFSSPETEKVELNIGTASVGGAYYAVGGGMANVVTQYAPNITMVPVVFVAFTSIPYSLGGHPGEQTARATTSAVHMS